MAWWRDIAYGVGAAVSSPAWGYALWKTGKWRTDWRGRLGHAPKLPAKGAARRLLIHAVSVGETNAIRQLVAMLAEQAPAVELVIASTTNTGFARASELFGAAPNVVAVVRYPLDFSCAVGRFLDCVQPDAAVMVELELWPNFAEACERRGVPLAVINGRLSDRSIGRYRMIRPLVHSSFARLSRAAVQTQAYADRFVELGAPADRVAVLDTMKWDTAAVSDHVDGADELAAAMGVDRTKPVVVAGSTGVDEEPLLVEAVRAAGVADVQLILVPRKPERFDEVARMFPGIIRRSTQQSPAPAPGSPSPSPKLFLLDTMGELRKAYALADVVVVGRSFVRMGGSDPIEPAGLGKAVIVGGHMQNFSEVVAAFVQADAMIQCDAASLAAQLKRLLSDREAAAALGAKARDVILSRRGATQRHVDMLLELLQ